MFIPIIRALATRVIPRVVSKVGPRLAPKTAARVATAWKAAQPHYAKAQNAVGFMERVMQKFEALGPLFKQLEPVPVRVRAVQPPPLPKSMVASHNPVLRLDRRA